MRHLLLTLTVFIISFPAMAVPITVNWTGFSAFDDATQTFDGITADSITWTGNGSYHDHGDGTFTTVDFELLLDGTWTSIYTDTTPADNIIDTISLASIFPITFTAATVTGIRLLSDPNINATYHNFADESFTFDSTAVPEPGSLALFGLGLIGLGFARRKHNSA